jgi:hypothetical protein
MTKPPTPRVAVSKDGDVLIFRGLLQSALFILRENLPKWLASPGSGAAMSIETPIGLALIEVILEAGASFRDLRDCRPPSIGKDQICLRFELPNGASAVLLGKTPAPAEIDWLHRQSADLIVGPSEMFRGTDDTIFFKLIDWSFGAGTSDEFHDTPPRRSTWPDLVSAVQQTLNDIPRTQP